MKEYKVVWGFKGWAKPYQIEKPGTSSRRWHFREALKNG